MADSRAFAKRLEEMSEEDKEHFRGVIDALSKCYGKDAAQGVVIVSLPNSPVNEVISLNATDMETHNLIKSVEDYFVFINTMDAPPKEQFN
jgi:prephenate dehydrogenase